MNWDIQNEILKNISESVFTDLPVQLQKALAVGGMVIKPLGIGSDKVQFLPQGQFVPLAFDASKRLTDVIFPEIKQISDTDCFIL